MSESFPAAGPVKTAIIGMITKDKEDAAARVKEDMNYQLTEKMTEYRPEHERMLYSLGLAGSAFKKVYFDPRLGRQAAGRFICVCKYRRCAASSRQRTGRKDMQFGYFTLSDNRYPDNRRTAGSAKNAGRLTRYG